MTELKPCPFCGELPELRGMGTLVHHQSCFNRILFDIDFWNTRKGEPRRCCANCVHQHPAYNGGCIDCDLIENPQLSEMPCDAVCDEWEADE